MTSSIFTIKTKAHSPNMINLGFNAGNFNVLIGHEVEDPNIHYIDLVQVSFNGSIVLNTTYTNQTSTSGADYDYPLAYSTGDIFEVYATCNEGGSITGCIICGVGSCPQSSGPEIPGYLGFWLIIGFSIIVSIAITYKKIRH
ncbi:MAG: hypothetical protein KGD65_03670 [Candidatus Lokiarchaeota archaeon]|nr:hypothetical protein [Candidatus Lokiarchaeota archaeon]